MSVFIVWLFAIDNSVQYVEQPAINSFSLVVDRRVSLANLDLVSLVVPVGASSTFSCFLVDLVVPVGVPCI